MLAPLTITDRDLDLLAAGSGDRSTIEMLLAGQFSRRVLLVRAVIEAARLRAPDVIGTLDSAYALLADVQRTHPGVVRSVLTLPCAGNWAAACLRPDASAPAFQYLACLAAVAAAAAGCDFEINAPVFSGILSLPASGSASIAGADAVIRVSRHDGLLVTGQAVRVSAQANGRAAGWMPARQLSADAGGQRIAVWLDDRSPFRSPLGVHLAAPLTPVEAARWQDTLDGAWQILASRHPSHLAPMGLALRTLTPLANDSEGNHSATAFDAFGAVLLTPPQHAEAMALTLVHEFQHAKLAALEHLVTLHSGNPRARYYAPWRNDPRPLGALLHGAYAHLGVAEYWYAATEAGAWGRGNAACLELGYWCAAVREAIWQLLGSGELTARGMRFAEGMIRALDRLATPVTRRIRAAAAERLKRDKMAWVIRNREGLGSAQAIRAEAL
jgi:HEXXH motif-containing protein